MENTVNQAPVAQLKTNKGLLKTILLFALPAVAVFLSVNKGFGSSEDTKPYHL